VVWFQLELDQIPTTTQLSPRAQTKRRKTSRARPTVQVESPSSAPHQVIDLTTRPSLADVPPIPTGFFKLNCLLTIIIVLSSKRNFVFFQVTPKKCFSVRLPMLNNFLLFLKWCVIYINISSFFFFQICTPVFYVFFYHFNPCNYILQFPSTDDKVIIDVSKAFAWTLFLSPPINPFLMQTTHDLLILSITLPELQQVLHSYLNQFTGTLVYVLQNLFQFQNVKVCFYSCVL